MRAEKKTGKKTAFVPRIIFNAVAAAAVVPLCAMGLAACGGEAVGVPTGDAAPDQVALGVALIMSDAGPDHIEWTVAAACFDGSGDPCPPRDAQPDIEFTVAASCFDGGPFCPDAKFGVADTGFSDVFLGVAFDAFALDAGKG